MRLAAHPALLRRADADRGGARVAHAEESDEQDERRDEGEEFGLRGAGYAGEC